MRNKIKIAIVTLLASFIFTSSLSVAADIPEIVYHGQQHHFSMTGTDHSDLFTNFKNMMPGDSVAQEINIRTKGLTRETSILLRAECADEDKKVLEQLRFHVEQDGKKIADSYLIQSPALIGTFRSDSRYKLKVILEIPESMSNDIANKNYHIKWTFIAQEDGEVIAEETVKTGDSSSPFLYVGVFLLSFFVLISVYIFRRKTQK